MFLLWQYFFFSLGNDFFYSSEFTITRENLFATNNVGNSNTIRRICIDIHKQTGKHFMCAHVYVKQEFKGSYVHCVWPSIVHHYGVWQSIFFGHLFNFRCGANFENVPLPLLNSNSSYLNYVWYFRPFTSRLQYLTAQLPSEEAAWLIVV